MTDTSIPYLSDPSGQEHPLEAPATRMGRAVENEIVVLDKRSSREHAVIRREGRKVFLEDQNSTNGTYLNGERLLQVVQLRDGDQIKVGDVAFVFHDPEMTSVETPFPELDVDLEAAEVRVDRRLVQLSSKEFALLTLLYENQGKVCSKDEIGQVVWSEYQQGVFDYQIENLVRRLRTKIENDPNAPQLLVTMRGLGYKLVG
ncbi:MAG: FHA domain-containing protein [Anaerolineales bacterium]|jgi:pSer/pThr/pTyr-binding forkhead associated (FHA) protein